MDADRFDALSRSLTNARSRRGALASLLDITFGLVGLDRTEAKKKCPSCKKAKNGKCKKNKPDGTACPGGTCQRGRCQPLADPCPGQRLCDGACIPPNQCCTTADCLAGSQCCYGVCGDKKPAYAACSQDTECCSDYCRLARPGVQNKTCAPTCRGKRCTPTEGCCRGFTCLNVDSTGHGTCGGCWSGGNPCASKAECCFSACTAKPGTTGTRCLSYPGEPCETSYDCWSCYEYLQCTPYGSAREICTNGVCGCPGECCANKPCPNLDQSCVFGANGLSGECRSLIP